MADIVETISHFRCLDLILDREEEELKYFYYRGLREWGRVNGYLKDTCLTAQDNYKKMLNYFKIK